MLYDQIQRKGKFIESCESSTTFWNCSDSVVFCVFHFIIATTIRINSDSCSRFIFR